MPGIEQFITEIDDQLGNFGFTGPTSRGGWGNIRTAATSAW
jgi:hypothetical protein